MSNDRLADLRNVPLSLDDAGILMREIALIEKRLAVSGARLEKKVADAKAIHNAETEGRRLALDKLRERLAAFITANPGLFQDPRTVKTEFGAFGLRTVTEVGIVDQERALQAVRTAGYDDCFATLQSLILPAVRKRLEAGENIPGVLLRSGDVVVCKVSKTLIDEAVKQLED